VVFVILTKFLICRLWQNSFRNKREGLLMAKYGPTAQKEVEKTMHEHKHEGKFKNEKQAIAVGLSKARQKGGKVPDEPKK
jgi:hypothetical protein